MSRLPPARRRLPPLSRKRLTTDNGRKIAATILFKPVRRPPPAHSSTAERTSELATLASCRRLVRRSGRPIARRSGDHHGLVQHAPRAERARGLFRASRRMRRSTCRDADPSGAPPPGATFPVTSPPSPWPKGAPAAARSRASAGRRPPRRRRSPVTGPGVRMGRALCRRLLGRRLRLAPLVKAPLQ